MHVATDLRTMTAIWMGLTTVEREREKMTLDGDQAIAGAMQSRLGLSPFAKQKKQVS